MMFKINTPHSPRGTRLGPLERESERARESNWTLLSTGTACKAKKASRKIKEEETADFDGPAPAFDPQTRPRQYLGTFAFSPLL